MCRFFALGFTIDGIRDAISRTDNDPGSWDLGPTDDGVWVGSPHGDQLTQLRKELISLPDYPPDKFSEIEEI